MAIFHLAAKVVSRKSGQSVIAKAAYNAREELTNERTGEVKDYTRAQGLQFSGIYTPANAPAWAHDRAQLWNKADQAESRKDSTLAREYELALPHELTHEQRRFLVQDFVRESFTRKGYAVDVAIHAPTRKGDERNYHAHILVSDRRLEAGGFAADKKERKLKSPERKAELEALREKWERTANRHLERYGHKARIDHRSLADQGIDREPTQHLGPYATQLERNGEESERGNINRDIEARNQEREQAQRDYEAAQREREQWEEKITQAAIAKAEEEQKREAALLEQYKQRAELMAKQAQQKAEEEKNQAVLLEQYKQRAELMAKQAREKAELEKQQAQQKEQREKQARESEEKAKQQIEAELATKQRVDKNSLEKKMKENQVGLFGRTAERLKQFIGHKLDEHKAEQRKEKLHQTIIENEGRNQDRAEARAARMDKAHERGQATVEIRQAEAREKKGIHAPERDEALAAAQKTAQRTNTEKDFRKAAEQTTSELIGGIPTERAQERLAEWKNQPAKPKERQQTPLDKTFRAAEKGRKAAGTVAREAGKGFRVLDKATGAVTGLSNGVASILDGIAKPVESLAEGISNMFSPPSPSPPPRRRERGPTDAQIRAAERALTNINESLKRGDDINAADLRNLPPSQLEKIRDGGDEYLQRMCKNWEIQQREREKENERER